MRHNEGAAVFTSYEVGFANRMMCTTGSFFLEGRLPLWYCHGSDQILERDALGKPESLILLGFSEMSLHPLKEWIDRAPSENTSVL
jgi:hypothetical protein